MQHGVYYYILCKINLAVFITDIMNKNYFFEYRHKWQPFDKILQAKTFEKIKRYSDTDVTSELKTCHRVIK